MLFNEVGLHGPDHGWWLEPLKDGERFTHMS